MSKFGLFLWSALAWYFVISFMMLDLDITHWSWVARMFLILLTAATYRNFEGDTK